MNPPPLLRHVPRWLVEALVTAATFFLAFRPLQGRPEALSLALTAMAAVGYTALTFELMLLGRRQVLTLTEQVATQREELEQNKAALKRQREEAARQAEHAEEARDAARRALLESVYARYDASAPQVSVSVQGEHLHRHLEDVDEKVIHTLPLYVERESFDHLKLFVIVSIDFYNFGPNAVLVTNAKKTSGRFTDSSDNPWPDVWLLKPSHDSHPLRFRWRYEGTIGHMLAVMGQGPPFGVQCLFEMRDLVGNVTDTHTLDFRFTAIERDGSRAKLPREPAPIILKDLGNRDTGGVATVERRYRDPLA
ncbi:hypothetical protein ACQPYA_03585 [Micromonospora sp. CA-263727]|uniref:hypothetical protein n=1 Tax=Micromonospora sp. CA-263727 TaxID=3239967 RepID=UPI003D8EE213